MCEEQECSDPVYSLAMICMDRVLGCCFIKKNQLQLLGTACMLIASKLRESRPLSAETLVFYTDNSVTKQQLTVSCTCIKFFFKFHHLLCFQWNANLAPFMHFSNE